MEEIEKLLSRLKEEPHEQKNKPEMIRRNKLVKWVRVQAETYKMMMRTKPDLMFMEGVAYVLNRLCDDFDIDGEEMQK